MSAPEPDLNQLLSDTLDSWARERPDLDLDAMGTALRLSQLMNVAMKAIDPVFAPHGITVGEFDVLAALRRGGAGTVSTPTALARVAMVSPAGMTNRLNRLEAAGLIDAPPRPRRSPRVPGGAHRRRATAGPTPPSPTWWRPRARCSRT
jgi:hypothetical protein